MTNRTVTLAGLKFERVYSRGERWLNDEHQIRIDADWGLAPRVGESGALTYSACIGPAGAPKKHKRSFRTLEGAARWAKSIVLPPKPRRKIEREPLYILYMGGLWLINHTKARELLKVLKVSADFDLDDYGKVVRGRVVERIEENAGENLRRALQS